MRRFSCCRVWPRPPPNIQLLTRTIPDDQIQDLFACCDCFVSPHRSEGFGLNIAQAMAHEKPVIVTGYSGNMDFTSAENSFLIDYDLVSAHSDSGPYRANFVWADPGGRPPCKALSHGHGLSRGVSQTRGRGHGRRCRRSTI